ncbi:MAG: DNA polymerase III subunit delta' [Streptococcaceae bacterium]|jgi:DNA polymerase-3 subunit delta'|nr:DNA polymerase III subunit delta' [Streptococcaceae bacterium]
MKIEEIQPQLYQTFQKLVKNDHLSHAYVFVGGFGNYDLAVWLAKAVFCQEIVEGVPCGRCRICRLIDANEFSELQIIEPDGQTIKVEQIRELLASFASTGFESTKKVVIIKDAEKMGQNAANALLKTIEEPDSEVYIFLLTENENLLLPTIQSRTQKVIFPKNTQYLSEFLQKKGLLKTDADLLAAITDSTDKAQYLAESSWYLPASKALANFVQTAITSAEIAFLKVIELLPHFEGKAEQEVAFDVLLVLFNQLGATNLTEKTFKAEKMWRANVRFGSCLESICL